MHAACPRRAAHAAIAPWPCSHFGCVLLATADIMIAHAPDLDIFGKFCTCVCPQLQRRTAYYDVNKYPDTMVVIILSAARGAQWHALRLARHIQLRSLSTNEQQQSRVVDIAICGGGVVGSALAARLASSPRMQGLKVAVIEAKAPSHTLEECKSAGAPDPRVFAITPSSMRTLSDAGAWDAITSTRRAPIFDQMQVWDALGPGYTRFHANYNGDNQLGWIIEQRVLQAALWETLQRYAARAPGSGKGADVTLLCPASVRSFWLPPAPDAPPLPPAAKAAHKEDTETGPHALAKLELSDGSTLKARLVVGADGAQSTVRSAARIGTWGWDYDQRGVVATVTTAEPHSTAWQRFLPEGPLAILPLWDNISSVVWSTTPQHAEALCAKEGPLGSAEAFTVALNAALRTPPADYQAIVAGGSVADGGPPHPFGGMGKGQGSHVNSSSTRDNDTSCSSYGRLGALYDQNRDALQLDPLTALTRAGAKAADGLAALAASTSGEPWQSPPLITATVGPRLSFPFRLSKANSYVRPRVALIGDAAHTVHPLAGQGLNLGIGDAEELASALAHASTAGADPGGMAALRRYERARAAHNLLMMGAMDVIKRVFTGRPGMGPGSLPLAPPGLLEPWVVARNVGMCLLQGSKPLKAHIARYAMGGR